MIFISEAKLNEAIEKAIVNVCRKQGIQLNEMAYSLGQYKANVNFMLQQIAENWCLVRYTAYDRYYQNVRHHWQNELFAHMNNIARMEITNRIGDISAKKKAISQVWSDAEFETNPQAVNMAVVAKMQDEGIDTTTDTYKDIINDFCESSQEIINVIASGNTQTIKNYIDSIPNIQYE